MWISIRSALADFGYLWAVLLSAESVCCRGIVCVVQLVCELLLFVLLVCQPTTKKEQSYNLKGRSESEC